MQFAVFYHANLAGVLCPIMGSDSYCPTSDDGPAASALADDCREFLESGDLPDWL